MCKIIETCLISYTIRLILIFVSPMILSTSKFCSYCVVSGVRWSGVRVFPLSCPLHYLAVSCKSVATLVPHLGSSVEFLASIFFIFSTLGFLVSTPSIISIIITDQTTLKKKEP
jgi:hypothetical protein